MWRALVLAPAFLWAAAISPTSANGPAVSTGDPKSLDELFKFGTFPASVGGKTRGVIYWRINIGLPRNAAFDAVEIPYLRPPIVRFRNGRCFQIEFDTDPNASAHIKNVRAEALDCPPPHKDTTTDLPPLSRPGMTFIGRAWDVDAYRDRRTGSTFLFQDRQKSSEPLLSTRMHVLSVGGMGCPDCGATTVRMFGYVGRELALADIEMNIDYAS